MLTLNEETTLRLSRIALEGKSNGNVDDYLGFKEISFHSTEKNEKEQVSLPSNPSFLSRLIPHNIFEALSQGDTLKIVLFFSMFGISLALIPENTSERVLEILEGIYKGSQFMVQKILIIFPIGLWALTATQFATFGFSLVSALTSILVFILIGTLIISLITLIVVRIHSGIKMKKILRSIKEMVVIAMGTSNSLASIPMGIKGLTETLGLKSYRVEGPFSLAVTLCRHGSILVISTASLFALNLYKVPITFSLMVYISGASILAAIAGTGAQEL